MFFAAVAIAALPALAAAQQITTIHVGPALTFSPNNVNVTNNNDIVQFVFDAPNHSVTQSTLAEPCTALDGGFSSGFSASAGDVWNLTVTDISKPIWFFCAQTSPKVHCLNGMVGAVNSPPDKLSSFTAAAAVATNSVQPSGSDVALSGSGAVATASITSASAVEASSTSPAGSGSSASGSASGSSPSSSQSSAEKPFAGFQGLGATVLALFGALLL